ncbi:MAG: SRPBCC domain-containing protein [Chitinophagaceae bacterium]
MTTNDAVYTKDIDKKTLHVVRSFAASLEQVWKAWTESEMLDKWWAPKPYRAETKTMDFRVGGYWLYCMMGPKGDNQWCRESYKKIEPRQAIHNDTNFCDADGNISNDFPTMHWTKDFRGDTKETTVSIEILFDSVADMDTVVKKGFREGFAAGLNNLEELLSI